MNGFQDMAKPSFEDMKQLRRETYEHWAELDIGLWLWGILCSREAMVSAGRLIFCTLKGEILWRFLLLILFFQKIKNKMRNFKAIYLKRDFHTLKVGGKKHKLRLTEDAIMQIEDKLDKPIYTTLEEIHKNPVEIVAIIWGTAQTITQSFSYEKAMSIFDDYIDDGHSFDELVDELHAMFESSDYIRKLRSEC